MTTAVHTFSPEEETASAERWSRWRGQNVVTSHTEARRARIAFTVLFAVLGSWLGLQLLTPSLFL